MKKKALALEGRRPGSLGKKRRGEGKVPTTVGFLEEKRRKNHRAIINAHSTGIGV